MDIVAAVTREKSAPFSVETIQLDKPKNDEVRVKIVATGMCHTDLVVRDQYYPVPLPSVLGHEGAGIVESVGADVTKVKAGDHVVLTYKSCGKCHGCYEGEPGYCDSFFSENLGGCRPDGTLTLSCNGEPIHGNFFQQSSFANYAIAHETNVVKVPKEAPLELLGPLGCGIQTGAGAVMNSLQPRAGSSIVIFGSGSVGLSAVMAARVVGCSVIIAVDLKASRRDAAMELGATHVIDPQESNTVELIQSLTAGGANFSLETTALPSVFREAVDCLALRGVCGLVGAPAMGTEVSFDMNNILFGRTVRGIIEGDSVPDIFIPRLLELYMQGRFPFDKLTRFYDLKDINQAAKDSESGTVIKPILRMPH